MITQLLVCPLIKKQNFFEACVEINDVKVLVTNVRLREFEKTKESSNVRVINDKLALLDFTSFTRNSKSLEIFGQKVYFYIEIEEYSGYYQHKLTVEVWEKQK